MNQTTPFDPNFCRNEREVESKLIVSYLLPALGYEISMWQQEKTYHRFRLDFLAIANQQKHETDNVIIEAKHPDKNLNDHITQLSQYMLHIDVKYGLLTNGREIRIYQKVDDEIRIVFNCFGRGVESKIDEIKALIGKKTLTIQSKDNSAMKIIAIYHNKGGVGKTTTVINLAATLSKQGKRILVIDMDSQANTTFATGLVNFGDEEKDTLKDNNIYHVLRHDELFSIKESVRKSRFTSYDMDVIPSHIHLMKHENELNQLDYSKVILIQKLKAVQEQYDVVLIDTPPSLNLYARVALITTDYLLIPSDLKPFANEGLENVKEFVKEIDGYRKFLSRSPIKILGVLPTKISPHAKFGQSTLQNRINTVEERYQIEVLRDCIIYERDDLAKCVEQTLEVGELEIADPRAVFDYNPKSKSVDEFEKLAQLISQRIGLT